MLSDKLQLLYCDTFVNSPLPFALLVVPLAGAYLYGRGKTDIAWKLIGIWIVIQITMSFLNNIVLECVRN